MKASFQHKTVNDPFGDPVLYVKLFKEKRALMFDCGDITPLSSGSMLKITDLFITHTHIDHFIGFDRLLRTLLSRKNAPLRIFGPANITDCVEGKLRGYTWNLIKSYPLSIEVNAIDGNNINKTIFSAQQEFKRQDKGNKSFDGIIMDEPAHKVSAIELSHEIPCMAYSLQESFHINVIKTQLEKRSLPVGSWLRELKDAIWNNRPDSTEIAIEGISKPFRLDELRDVVQITRGQKIAYITDVTPIEDNIAKATGLAMGADTIYCETFFLGCEQERAMRRNHLTSAHAARIVRNSGASRLVPIHFSDKYKGLDTNPGLEAQELLKS